MDRGKRYQVIGVKEINAALGFERLKDAVGREDTSCAAEIGGALGVQYLLTGSVGVLGKELLVQLTLMDVTSATVIERGRGVVANDENLYRQADGAPRCALRNIAGRLTMHGSRHSGWVRHRARENRTLVHTDLSA